MGYVALPENSEIEEGILPQSIMVLLYPNDGVESQIPVSYTHLTAQARVIAAGRDLFSDSTGILSYALNTNGYTYTLDARDPEARMTDSRTDAFLTAQTADFIYRQTMDAMEGNPVNSTMSLQVPEGTDKRIFFMAKDLDKGTLTPDSKACQSAVNVFDRMFSLPLNLSLIHI